MNPTFNFTFLVLAIAMPKITQTRKSPSLEGTLNHTQFRENLAIAACKTNYEKMASLPIYPVFSPIYSLQSLYKN